MPKPWDLIERTRQFADDVCDFCRDLPEKREAQELASQLRRAGRGVASNYRAARRARSDAEFVAKLGTVVEEADEAHYWLDHLFTTRIASSVDDAEPLRQEANELTAIFATAHKTAELNQEIKKRTNRRRTRRRR